MGHLVSMYFSTSVTTAPNDIKISQLCLVNFYFMSGK